MKSRNAASDDQEARPYSVGHALKSTRDVRGLKGAASACTVLCLGRFFKPDA
jgi:hypothetical protein